MNITWNTIRPGEDDPIRGEPVEFDQVETRFHTIKSNTCGIGAEFAGISAFSKNFSGQAAASFSEKMSELVTPLNDVPVICQRVEDLFRHHAAELRRLQHEADSALARAQTNWNLVERAHDDQASARKRLRIVEQQLDDLDAQGAAADPTQRNYWINEQSEVDDWTFQAKSATKRAEAELRASSDEWQHLRNFEEDLDNQTADGLRNMELWSMGDPSLLEQFAGALVDLVDMFADFSDYVFSMDFIEDLYHVLDVVLTVLSVVSIILAFIALIPGLQAVAALAALVATVSAVLAVVKALLGVALFLDGRISGWALVVDIGTAALSVIGAAASVAKNGSTAFSKIGMNVDEMSKVHNFAVRTIESRPLFTFSGFAPQGSVWADDVITGVDGLTTVHALHTGAPFAYHYHAIDHARDGATKVLSNFDFDPPPNLFRVINPMPIVMVPTGWNP